MKEAVFLIGLVVGVPLIAVLLRVLPMGHRLGLAGLVASVTYIVDVNFDADMAYRGVTRGLTVSSADLYAWGLGLFLLLQLRRRGSAAFAPRLPGPVSPIVWWPALSTAYLAFITINVLALLGADRVVFGLYDVMKLVSGLIVFWVAANVVVDDRMADAVPRFLAIFVAVEVLFALKGFLGGQYWLQGTFPHKNSFAFAMNAVLPFLLARALLRPRHRLLFLAIYGAGAVAVILSRSRTGWMTLMLGAGVVVTLSMIAAARFGRREDVRRIGVLVGGMAMIALVVLAKLADGIIARWDESAEASSDFRHVHVDVALDIISDNPFGVGANNYVAELQKPVGDPIPEIDKIVIHNAYLLIAAEAGVVGLVAFLVLLASFGVIAVRLYRKARTMRGLYVAAGAIAALLGSALHGMMESHGFLERHNYLVWCLLVGVVVAVGQREGIDRVSLVRWLLRRRDRRLGLQPRPVPPRALPSRPGPPPSVPPPSAPERPVPAQPAVGSRRLR